MHWGFHGDLCLKGEFFQCNLSPYPPGSLGRGYGPTYPPAGAGRTSVGKYGHEGLPARCGVEVPSEYGADVMTGALSRRGGHEVQPAQRKEGGQNITPCLAHISPHTSAQDDTYLLHTYPHTCIHRSHLAPTQDHPNLPEIMPPPRTIPSTLPPTPAQDDPYLPQLDVPSVGVEEHMCVSHGEQSSGRNSTRGGRSGSMGRRGGGSGSAKVWGSAAYPMLLR